MKPQEDEVTKEPENNILSETDYYSYSRTFPCCTALKPINKSSENIEKPHESIANFREVNEM